MIQQSIRFWAILWLLWTTSFVTVAQAQIYKQDTTGFQFFQLAEANHNDFEKYIVYAKKALPLLKKERKFKEYTLTLTGLMFINYYKAKMEIAFSYADSLEYITSTKLISKEEAFITLNRLGTFYYNNDLYKQAETIYEKSYTLWKERSMKNSSVANLGQYYNNKGLLFGAIGDFYQAVNYYKKALVEFAKYPKIYHFQSAITLHNIGMFYNETKDFKNALSCFNQAINLHLAHPIEGINKRYYASALLDKGLLFLEMKEFLRAKELFQQVLQLPELRQDFYAIANCLLGATFIELEQYKKGKELLDVSLEQQLIFFSKKDLAIALTFRNISIYHHKKGDFEAALKNIEKAINQFGVFLQDNSENLIDIEINQTSIQEIELVKMLRWKAQIQQRTGKKESALKTYQLIVQIILAIKPTYQSIESKYFLSENTSQILEEALRLTHQLYKENPIRKYLEIAFYFFEVNQSTLLLEANNKARAVLEGRLPNSIVVEKERLITQINFLKKQKLEQRKEGAKRNTVDEKLFGLENDLSHLNKEIEQLYPTYYKSSKHLRINTLSDLQKTLLSSQQVLMSYFYGDSTIFMLSISRNEAFLYELPKELIEQQLITFNIQISPQTINHSSIDYQQLPFLLYRNLIQDPLQNHPDIKELLIIPDKLLFQLPFEALWSSKQENSTIPPSYLIQKYAVNYIPSVSFLMSQEKSKPLVKPPVYAGFAPNFKGSQYFINNRSCEIDSLPRLDFNEIEVNEIGQNLNGKVYFDSTATKANFLQSAETTQILHLATHACMDDALFNQSRIFFTDDYLFVHELFHIKTSAKMVVLSACETGIGKYQRGEGMLSLAHGFAYAGVPSITMSLWSVNDQSTAELMQYYYQQLKKGLPKHQALRQAKLMYLANQESSEKLHPYYWAGFVHLGDFQPIFLTNTTSLKDYFFLTLLALSIVCFFLFKKKYKKIRLTLLPFLSICY